MADVLTESTAKSTQRMQCMEVWGGNCEVDNSIEMPGLNSWVYSKPYGNSSGGGDVYYVSSCASGRITRVLLADVSGHGAAVSKLALGLRDLMRRNVNVVKQTRFVEGMNRQFTELSQSGSFATALVATFYQPTSRLTLCNAGHPDPLYYDASQGIWSLIEQSSEPAEGIAGTPLGVHDQACYPQVERLLDCGDLVLFFSDALTESLDSDGRMLGIDGLLQLTSRVAYAAPSDLLPSLLATIESSHPDNILHDDLTMVLLEATGTSTRLGDNLLALFRLLRPVGDSTKLS